MFIVTQFLTLFILTYFILYKKKQKKTIKIRNKLKFKPKQYKFEDLIELEISIINKIRGLIEKLSRFGVDSG